MAIAIRSLTILKLTNRCYFLKFTSRPTRSFSEDPGKMKINLEALINRKFIKFLQDSVLVP